MLLELLSKRKGINNATTIADPLKTKQPLIYSLVKVGDVVTVNTKGLFEDDHQLMDV
jgi:trigger factor